MVAFPIMGATDRPTKRVAIALVSGGGGGVDPIQCPHYYHRCFVPVIFMAIAVQVGYFDTISVVMEHLLSPNQSRAI